MGEQQPLSTTFLCLDKSLKREKDLVLSCSTDLEMDWQKYIFNGEQFYMIQNHQTTLFGFLSCVVFFFHSKQVGDYKGEILPGKFQMSLCLCGEYKEH